MPPAASGADPPWIGDAYGVLARSMRVAVGRVRQVPTDVVNQSLRSCRSRPSASVENRKPGLTPREAFPYRRSYVRLRFLQSLLNPPRTLMIIANKPTVAKT